MKLTKENFHRVAQTARNGNLECQQAIESLALSALDSQGSGWMPIADAPKDGTQIIGAYRYEGKWFQHIVWWDAEFEMETDYAGERDQYGFYQTKYRGGWEDGKIDTDECPSEYFPTHWMPLPSPPKEPK